MCVLALPSAIRTSFAESRTEEIARLQEGENCRSLPTHEMKSVDKVSVGSDDPLGFMSAPSGGRKKAGAFMAKDIPVEKLSSPFDTDALKTVDMGDRKLNVKKRESVHSQDRQERGLMGNGEMRGLGAGKSTKELFSSSSAASSSSGPSADPLAFLKQVKEESHDGDLFGSNSGGGGDTGGDSSVFSSVEGAHARPTSSSMSSSSSSSSQPRIGTKVGDDEEEGNVGDLMVGQAMRKEEVTEEDRAVFGHSAAKAKAAIAVVKQELGEEGVAEEEAALSAIDQVRSIVTEKLYLYNPPL